MEQPACFFGHARVGGHPEASGKADKQILDSRYRIESGTGPAGMTKGEWKNSPTPQLIKLNNKLYDPKSQMKLQ